MLTLIDSESDDPSGRQWPDHLAMVCDLIRTVPQADAEAKLQHLAMVAMVESACAEVRQTMAENWRRRRGEDH